MKIYKITEASEYLGVSINTLKTLANNGKIKSLEKKYEEELAEDIISVIHSFSGKLYGMRSKVKEEVDKELS